MISTSNQIQNHTRTKSNNNFYNNKNNINYINHYPSKFHISLSIYIISNI